MVNSKATASFLETMNEYDLLLLQNALVEVTLKAASHEGEVKHIDQMITLYRELYRQYCLKIQFNQR